MTTYVLDTNSFIYALQKGYIFPKNHYLVSVITEMELLSYSKLTLDDEKILKDALSNFRIIDLQHDVKVEAIRLRKEFNLKLPDSIIVATSFVYDAILVTSDKQLLKFEVIKSFELMDL